MGSQYDEGCDIVSAIISNSSMAKYLMTLCIISLISTIELIRSFFSTEISNHNVLYLSPNLFMVRGLLHRLLLGIQIIQVSFIIRELCK